MCKAFTAFVFIRTRTIPYCLKLLKSLGLQGQLLPVSMFKKALKGLCNAAYSLITRRVSHLIFFLIKKKFPEVLDQFGQTLSIKVQLVQNRILFRVEG